MKLRLLLVGCAVLMASSATADPLGGIKQGAVKVLMADALAPSKVFVKVDGSFTQPKAGCAYSATYDFVIDISNAMGKAWYPLLLAAQASGAQVEIGGTGSCTHYATYEDVQYVRVST